MQNYISSIKTWFKADYDGRHLEIFLLEIAKRRPEVLSRYLSKELKINHSELKNARYDMEVIFKGSRSMRRADLAVYREDEDDPFILIEIKYLDKPLPETATSAAQLSDYLAWKKSDPTKRHVLILSREMYNATELEIRRWDHFARSMRKPAKTSELLSILVEFLEEEGIVMQNIECNALQRYFTRLVCNHRNVGRAAGNLQGPIEFAKVLKNLQLMSGAFTPYFKNAWAKAGEEIDGVAGRSNIANIDFCVNNDLKSVKGTQTYRDQYGRLPLELKDGGSIDVFATHSLGHNKDDSKYLRIEYGISFATPGSFRPDGDTQHTATLFVNLYGGNIANIPFEKNVAYSLVTDKAETSSSKVEVHLRKGLHTVISQALKSKAQLHAKQTKALQLLERSLASNQKIELKELEKAA